MDMKKTGELIAQRRKDLSLTQAQLADAVGVTDKAISRWETGRGFPDAAYLQPLSQALGISITEIVNGEQLQPEQVIRQTDDALLSAFAYSKRMHRTTVAVILAIAGIAALSAPLYVVGTSEAYLPYLGLFLLALAAMLHFWKKGPSPLIAQVLSTAASVAVLVLQALPLCAVLVFMGPDYNYRKIYSCFDLMPWGYANFSPGISAILNVVVLILMALVIFLKKDNLRNGAYVCTILSGAFMALPPLLMGTQYLTAAAAAVILLQFTSAVLQARANSVSK